MASFSERIHRYSDIYANIKNGRHAAVAPLPGQTYFIENNEILSIPGDDGDCRYPYVRGKMNFWNYSSGYMSCNQGLFSPFLRAKEGQEPTIAFFAGFPAGSGEYSYHVVPLLSVPEMISNVAVDRYTVFSESAAYYITQTQDICFVVRTFADIDSNLYFTLSVENLSNVSKELFISAYFNPFLNHGVMDYDGSRWFREATYCDRSDGTLGQFVIRMNEDLSRTLSVSNYGVIHRELDCGGSRLISHEETTSRFQYAGGRRSSLHSPKSLFAGTFGTPRHICAFTDTGIAGDILKLEVSPLDRIIYQIGIYFVEGSKNEADLNRLITQKMSIETVEKQLRVLEAGAYSKSNSFACSFGKSTGALDDKVLNPFINSLMKQVEFCSLIRGYTQLSVNSLIGIRDVFQALEAFLIWQPGAVRRKMLEALDFISTDGRCPRQYSLPVRGGGMPVMDLRPFIDQGTWVIETVITYLKYTNDYAFLKEVCGYYDIVDEKSRVVSKNTLRDSVLDHLLKILDYLISHRDTGNTNCVCALFGDWNDALDGLGVSNDPSRKYGTGVSVMVTLQVYQNLCDMAELLRHLDTVKYQNRIEQYLSVAREIERGLQKYAIIENESGEKRIIHGWGDQRSYLVGSFHDPDGQSRYSLTSNAFWVLSGQYKKDMSIKDTVLHTFERLDSKYGLKTFEPYFPEDSQGVGRIRKLPAGTAENGAAYVHASAFGIMALFQMGCPQAAWVQLGKSLPFTHKHITCSPYVMPNSYGFNEEKLIDGESMNDWQTGSSNVILKTLVKYVFGINPDFDGIWIQPATVIPFESFQIRLIVKDCEITLRYLNKATGTRKYYVNDMERKGIFDEELNISKLWIGKEQMSQKMLIRVDN